MQQDKKIVRSNYIKHSEISDGFLIFSTIEDVMNVKSFRIYDDQTHIPLPYLVF